MTVHIFRNSDSFSDQLSGFSSTSYLGLMAPNHGWFVSDNFILPFLESKDLFIRKIWFTTTPIHRSGGLCLEKETEFLTNVVKTASTNRFDLIAQPLPNALFDTHPEGSIAIPYGSYRVDLEKRDEQELFAMLHQKQRNVVRKAQKDGVQIYNGPSFAAPCQALIQTTLNRQGKPSIHLQQMLGLRDAPDTKVCFYLARLNNVDQGAAVFIIDRDTSYYVYGGTAPSPHNGAMALLHWTAMLDMKRLGLRTYDFVGARLMPLPGSKQESIQRFKARFGGMLKQGSLWKYPLRPLKYKLFCRTRKILHLLSLGQFHQDIIDNEIQCLQVIQESNKNCGATSHIETSINSNK
jgi:lipid II:glycine glycyltransferase (peptidoglycan interpeptide bridge formation enzyme)